MLYPQLQRLWPGDPDARGRRGRGGLHRGRRMRRALSILRRSAELDATILGIAQALPGPARDLDVVYLPGLDIAQHALLGAPDGSAPAPSAIAARVDALRSYYAFLDAIARAVGSALAQTRSSWWSRSRGGSRARCRGCWRSGRTACRSSWRSARREWWTSMPTVLYALGVPHQPGARGASRSRAVRGIRTSNASRERYVSTYGRPVRAPGVTRTDDRSIRR